MRPSAGHWTAARIKPAQIGTDKGKREMAFHGRDVAPDAAQWYWSERADLEGCCEAVAVTSPAGRILSVNVGMPRDVEWEGRTVRTGIWKDPVAGRRMVRRLNVDGDGQGDLSGHGGVNRAVFVYQIESYRYWQKFL